MKKNLIPTLVVDKNGKHTTVYRKPADSQENSSGIPSPSPLPSHVAKRRESISLTVASMFKAKPEKVSEINETVASYSPEFLYRVEEALEDENVSSSVAYLIQKGRSEREVGEAIRFLPHYGMTGFYGGILMIKSLHGFKDDSGERRYAGIPIADDYSRADEKVQLQCESLLRVSDAVRNCSPDWPEWMTLAELEDGSTTMVLKDERMVALALERYGMVDVIEQTIISRENADYELISSALENALGPGSL